MPVLQCFLRDQKLLSGKRQRYFSTQTECWRVGNSPSERHIGQPCLWWLEICQQWEKHNKCMFSISLYLKFYWRCGTIKVYGSTIFYWVFFVGPTPMNSNSQQTIILKTVLNHYLYKKIHGIMFKRSSKILAYYRNWPLWFLIILQ